ncbi:hypothetical protein H2198_000200 [Neophaeococcomyces mojaviensis]|uniref:Uncharacterized protein n=1 Tax=Neophaeococcomyces mojaviensis TaxID=3383035 RepID=A0ACC3AKH1_9EURO|nr:hypothetical protein H2198_000200 [Knufia sp. JES_112]
MHTIFQLLSKRYTRENTSSSPLGPDVSHVASKHIVVAGAGIAGLSFALSLHKLWPASFSSQLPRITIIERDSKADRLGREGYTLSIRVDGNRGGGVQVLDDLGLYEVVRDVAVIVDSGIGVDTDCINLSDGKQKAGNMVLWDKNWRPLLKVDPEKMQNESKRKLSGMRIRRNALQEVLANATAALPDVTMMWERRVVNVKNGATGAGDSMVVVLDDGSNISCDIIIAADGSKSKIRTALRPSDGLNYSGVVAISGNARFESRDQIPKPLANDWGALLGWTGVGIFVAPVDPTAALWSLSYRAGQPRDIPRKPFSNATISSLLEEARGLGIHAGPKFRTLVDNTDPSTLMVFNAFDRPPFRHDFEKHGNVIWIGDANHAVTPFAGNGANMAMMDSWDLVKELVKGEHGGFEKSVRAWERSMMPRTEAVLKESHRNMDVGHAVGWKAWFYWSILKVLALFT